MLNFKMNKKLYLSYDEKIQLSFSICEQFSTLINRLKKLIALSVHEKNGKRISHLPIQSLVFYFSFDKHRQ